jgi:hypothetical protein
MDDDGLLLLTNKFGGERSRRGSVLARILNKTTHIKVLASHIHARLREKGYASIS